MVEKKDEASREIMGVARIGELAKGLLLSGSFLQKAWQPDIYDASGFFSNSRGILLNSEVRDSFSSYSISKK